MIEVAFFATAREIECSISFQIECPHLVSARHCKDQCVSIDSANVPRRRQLLCFSRFIALFIETLFTSSDNCKYLLALEVNFSDRMILGITNVDVVIALSVNVTQALWVVELHLIVISIDQANLAISNDIHALHGFFIYHDQTVIRTIRNDY